MDPPTAPRAVEDPGDELVLDGVLRPQEVGMHEPRRSYDCVVVVAGLTGLLHQLGGLMAEPGELPGGPEEGGDAIAWGHGLSV